MTVQRLVDAERKVSRDSIAEVSRLKATQALLENKIAQMQKMIDATGDSVNHDVEE